MLNSSVLELAIGMVFCYASVALLASSIYESISSVLSLRAKTLFKGLKQLLNDQQFKDLAYKVYSHGLVSPLASSGAAAEVFAMHQATAAGAVRSPDLAASKPTPEFLPSYIPSKDFAKALIDSLQIVPGNLNDLKATIDSIPDPQIRQVLQGFWARSEGKLENLQEQVADWFDNAMERVSGGYKRWAQLWTFCIAFVFSALFCIDSVQLFSHLWVRPALMTALAHADMPQTLDASLSGLSQLPLGWGNWGDWGSHTGGEWLALLFGWAITASAAMFGAPFWFDMLQRLVQLRGSGAKPPTEKQRAST